MIRVIKVHADVCVTDLTLCGEKCDFMSRNNFCYLFKKYIVDNKRCEDCVDKEFD